MPILTDVRSAGQAAALPYPSGMDPLVGSAAHADSEVPTGRAQELLEWVGTDRRRAARALHQERQRLAPRLGVLTALEDLVR